MGTERLQIHGVMQQFDFICEVRKSLNDATSASKTNCRVLTNGWQFKRLVEPNGCIVADRQNWHIWKKRKCLDQPIRLVGLNDIWDPRY